MSKYGQYCPIAQALEVVGDRWTLLIIRDMLTGTRHFNDLERGLPGISRALLAKRLRQLQTAGIVEKHEQADGRRTTAYELTQAGRELQPIIGAFLTWGANWAFGEPTPEQLDPLLLMWWIHQRVHSDRLPQERVVTQFNFYGAKTETYWLVLTRDDVTLCLTDPGYEINLLVRADLATFFKVWLGRIEYEEALASGGVDVAGLPRYVRALPTWLGWSLAADSVRAARQRQSQVSEEYA